MIATHEAVADALLRSILKHTPEDAIARALARVIRERSDRSTCPREKEALKAISHIYDVASDQISEHLFNISDGCFDEPEPYQMEVC